MSLKKSIFKVFTANFVQLITSVVTAFVVPFVVSVENYSQIKTYMLYSNYVALFSMGFYEGIYIKYGGKEKCTLDNSVVKSEHSTFFIFQIFIMMLWILISILNVNVFLLLFALTILPVNLFTYYKRLHLATGDFERYRTGMLIYSVSYLALNCLLAAILRVDAAVPYCICIISANILAALYNIFVFFKSFRSKSLKLFDLQLMKTEIKMGWLILLGNLIVNIIYSVDRWFVKFAFTNKDFSYYSFAVSMLNIVMVLIQAVGLSLYNYLAKEKKDEEIKTVAFFLLGIGTLASSGYYLLHYVVGIFLNKYIPSLNIIAVSFAAYPYMILINSIYLNLYKTNKKDAAYIRSVLFMIIVSCILNCLALVFRSSTVPIAIATTVSFIIWYLLCQKDFGWKYKNKGEATYLLIMMTSFFVTNIISVKIISFLIYVSIWFVVTYIFARNARIKIKKYVHVH